MSPAEQIVVGPLRAQVAIDRDAPPVQEISGWRVTVAGVRSTADTVEAAVARAVGSLIPRGATVLVACSGGADSVALAAAFADQRGVRAAIGHVDHGLRAESACEADSVRALAQSLGLLCFVERLRGLRLAEVGLEAAAREARYPALARLAEEAGASVVVTAHTRRDQAETLLLRLARGAGPGALGGVREQRSLAPGISLVRPLLSVARATTEALCARRGLSFANDPHNVDPARGRGRLRRAWSVLSGLNPRLEEALAGAALLLAEQDDLIAGLVQSALVALSTEGGLDAHGLAALHPALQRRCLLRAAVDAGARPEKRHLEALRRSLSSPRFALDLPGGRARLVAGVLRFHRPEASARQTLEVSVTGQAPEVSVTGPGSYSWKSRSLAVIQGEAEGIVVDLARAPFPWTLRGHRPGDRFRPGGGRTRKVADLWIDARIPRERRNDLAVLQDAAGILFWVEGVRSGEACRGSKTAPATFVMCSEMDGGTGALV